MSAEQTMTTYWAVIPFVADNDEQARMAVASYAEGLGALCPEVEFYQAKVQGLGESTPRDVFCGTPGPEWDQFCVSIADHGVGTLHRDEAGRTWGDGEVPSAPDSIEGLDR